MNAAWKIYLDEQDQTNPKVQGFLKVLDSPVGGGTQAGGGTPPKVPPVDQRQANRTYMTPKGPMKWTGTGWLPPS